MKNNIESVIKKIKLEIKKHNYLYYVLNKPKISDLSYDILFKKLSYLKKKNKFFKKKKNIFGNKKNFKLTHHHSKMLSLENTFSIEGMFNFYKKVLAILKKKKIKFCGELKYDGVAVNLIYKNRTLYSAAMRGNGEIGENITKNIKFLPSIPKFLNNKKFPNFLEIRGEIYIYKKKFHKLNKQNVKNKKLIFSTARNLAAGSLRQKNYKISKNRNLIFVCHGFNFFKEFNDIKYFENNSFYNILKKIKHVGFYISKKIRLLNSFEDIKKFYKYIKRKRKSIPFEIDGIVIKINSLKSQKLIGYNNKFPKWALALKFLNQSKTSTLLHVNFEVGRTGVITPVAIFKPIKISGVLIQKASLFNYNYIKNLNLYYKDTIIVQRSGDVIPKIIGVIFDRRKKNFKKVKFLRKCPSCHTNLISEKNKNIYYCNNGFFCISQKKKKILHFFSKNAIEILGFRKNIILQLIKNKILNNPSDIFKLKKKNFLNVKKVSVKTINLILNQINNMNSISLERFIFSLGILGVGKEASKKISKHCVTFEKFLNLFYKNYTKKFFLKIPGIGINICKNIYNFLSNSKNKKIISLFKKFIF
ncbi:NAD-dependent DNA ligase LigA [Buchnera aphidicola]|uniref:NAD-dependent DNA ligase LigA n=1 Tax=Buchnera aphidicola TaxID=9 RepID=UPI0030EF394C